MTGNSPDTRVILCYKDKTTAVSNGWYAEMSYGDIDNWKKTHPNLIITHMFTQNSDIIARDNTIETSFLANCFSYGLKPDDLHGIFRDSRGHAFELLGMKTGNTKYKFIIWDQTASKRYKVSGDYIKSAQRTA